MEVDEENNINNMPNLPQSEIFNAIQKLEKLINDENEQKIDFNKTIGDLSKECIPKSPRPTKNTLDFEVGFS